ncbi:MAG: DUF1794 domain-containing protein [Deltaproteobacteria bacterium]|nr:MAG: DUF1794 domain-containing protein [Deltaproteobacteria bacterium]
MAASAPSSFGPLSLLPGTWEGEVGTDVAPGADRSAMCTPYRERIVFEPVGEVENHEQRLAVLRYHQIVWPADAADPFHDEVGYLAWDPAAGMVTRSFTIPRAMAVLAGGRAHATARYFVVEARAGDPCFGIVENPFLHRKFRTVRFEARYEVRGDAELRYAEDTVLRIDGRDDLFHHRDANVLRKRRDA